MKNKYGIENAALGVELHTWEEMTNEHEKELLKLLMSLSKKQLGLLLDVGAAIKNDITWDKDLPQGTKNYANYMYAVISEVYVFKYGKAGAYPQTLWD